MGISTLFKTLKFRLKFIRGPLNTINQQFKTLWQPKSKKLPHFHLISKLAIPATSPPPHLPSGLTGVYKYLHRQKIKRRKELLAHQMVDIRDREATEVGFEEEHGKISECFD